MASIDFSVMVMSEFSTECNNREINNRAFLKVFTLKVTKVNSMFCYTSTWERSCLECMNQGEARGLSWEHLEDSC